MNRRLWDFQVNKNSMLDQIKSIRKYRVIVTVVYFNGNEFFWRTEWIPSCSAMRSISNPFWVFISVLNWIEDIVGIGCSPLPSPSDHFCFSLLFIRTFQMRMTLQIFSTKSTKKGFVLSHGFVSRFICEKASKFAFVCRLHYY